MSVIEKRKQAHLDLCLQPESQGSGDLFSRFSLSYRALPELSLAEVSTTTELLGKKLQQPLIIASMTGGVAHAKTINVNLAIAAEASGVAIGVGSQRIALEKVEAKETFTLVRQHAPTTCIFANMGAVQLNYGRGIEDYQRVVDMIQADALYLHLNPLQEALQPEGDTNFCSLLDKIGLLVKAVTVPVFVKEVGHGLDPQTAQMLIDRGIKGIDTAGVGGTSWAWVEAERAKNIQFKEWFKDFGYRTDDLLVAYQRLRGSFTTVASGGIRTPIEGTKARALGADLISMAQPFLTSALASPEAVMDYLKSFQKGLQITLFTCGCPSWQAARSLALQPKT